MIYFISAIMFFCLFIATHVVCFRVRLMKFQLSALLLLSFIWLVVYLSSLFMAPGLYQLGSSGRYSLLGVPLVLTSLVIYILLCLCYIVECSGIKYESPSMQIMLLVDRHDEGKISYDELREVLTDERLILPRLGDLVSSGFVTFDGTRYFLLPRGAMIALVFAAYRRLLQSGIGG